MRNHIKLLTYEELAELNERYQFIHDSARGTIIVKCKNFNRSTEHTANEQFSILCLNLGQGKNRKITFSQNAIDLWIKLQSANKDYSLFEVQQAVNKLELVYQEPTINSVCQAIENGIAKIE